MNQNEIEARNLEFVEAIEHYCGGAQVTLGDSEDEFSWSQCDSCGSRLGGSRHEAHIEIEGEWHEIGICCDCVQFWANGELPADGWGG